MAALRWLARRHGRASARARCADRWALPAGAPLRVGSLGLHGIMATSTTVDAAMVVAMLAMKVTTTTTARPMTAPMLIALAAVAVSSRR
eukprot:2979483-Pyramimonas_sp.AAC.1